MYRGIGFRVLICLQMMACGATKSPGDEPSIEAGDSGEGDVDESDADTDTDDDTDTAEPTWDDSDLKEDGVADLPPFHLDPERPFSGDNVTVSIDLDGSTDVDLDVSGSGCGDMRSGSGSLPYTLTGTAASDGHCQFTAAIASADGAVERFAGSFEIQSTDPAVLPLHVAGGVLEFGASPVPSEGADAPTIDDVTGADAFVNGTTTTLTVETDAEDIQAVLVGVEGFDGYYFVPVADDAESVRLSVSFPADLFSEFSAPADPGGPLPPQPWLLETMVVTVAVVTGTNLVSNWFEKDLEATEVGTGEVQVGVTWDTPTDVDLHVIEPGGEEIYYSNSTSATGGELDLDSNPSCSIDGINSENVYWPEGAAPQGDFEVRLHMYDDCDVGGASGTLTVTYCGDDSPMVEDFTLGSTDTEQSWTFTSECAYSVAGLVRYEDVPVTVTGMAGTTPTVGVGSAKAVPARFVTVQVIRDSDDEVLAEGSTDLKGKYKVDFENTGDPGYRVRVLAKQNSDQIKQKVTDLSGDVYAWESEVQLETDEAHKEGVDITVEDDDNSGALNIFNVGVDGIQFVSTRGKSVPPMLTWKWTAGSKPEGNDASYYRSTQKTIYVLGRSGDPDEFDDVVLGHEFGHFALDVYSETSGRGRHSSYNRVAPNLAWSEGTATYIALAFTKTTAYVDYNTGSGIYYSVETLPSGIPTGNAGSSLDGKVSEAIVSAVLLDLHDKTNETNDTITGAEMSVWQVLRTYLASGYTSFADRGKTGRDLVDFLDGWRCLGLGSEGTDDVTGLRGNVLTLHALSYDFTTLASCR